MENLDSRKPAIGFFDSGIGGLSVWMEVVKLLPEAITFYIADNLNCPYGSKKPEEILDLSRSHVKSLLASGCGVIVVACNTATAACIEVLRKEFPIPFVGMEPAIKPAALRSVTKSIGVLATQGTLRGKNHFLLTKNKCADDVQIHTAVADDFVRLVESGDVTSRAARAIVCKHIEPLLDAGVDKLVLGCTHFVFLRDLIEDVVAGRAEVIDSGEATAKQVCKIFNGLKGIANKTLVPTVAEKNWQIEFGSHHFFASGNLEILEKYIDPLSK